MANSYRELLESLAANRYDSYENAVVNAFNDEDDEAALRIVLATGLHSEPILCWHVGKVYLCVRSNNFVLQKIFNNFALMANIPLEFIPRGDVYLVSYFGELNYTKYEPVGFWPPLLECLKPELYQLTTDEEMQEFADRHKPL